MFYFAMRRGKSGELDQRVEDYETMLKESEERMAVLAADNFFKQGDKAVRLYNEAYYKPAKAMIDELKSKDLLKDSPWIDEFQITIYYLWHHQ